MKSSLPRILMLLENSSFPEDCRVLLEAQSLTSAGFEVIVICPTEENARKKSQRVGNIQVYRYPQPIQFGGFLGYLVEYAYSLAMQFCLTIFVFFRHGFDAIHMHTPPDVNCLIPLIFKPLGKKFVYDLHDLSPELYQAQRNGLGNRWIYWLLLRFERLASSTADLLIATNETQRNIQIDRGGARSEQSQVVRNGPNEAFLQVVKPRKELMRPGVLNIGYVGVISIQDGVDNLVRAISLVRNNYGSTGWQVVIVGDGPAASDLRELISALQLTDNFVFTGMVPFSEVPTYIAAFDICSTPDPSNPYNDSCTTIKTMEYMAMRKPIVCFETVENRRTAGSAALYAKENSIIDYAAMIVRLMDDADLRRKMGEVGRSRIEDGLTWNQQALKLVDAYDGLFGIDRQAAPEAAWPRITPMLLNKQIPFR